MGLGSSRLEPEEGSGVGATRGRKGLWSRDPHCPAGTVLTVQAIGDASVVRWLQRVVQGCVRGDSLVFRGRGSGCLVRPDRAAAGPGSAGSGLGLRRCGARPAGLAYTVRLPPV